MKAQPKERARSSPSAIHTTVSGVLQQVQVGCSGCNGWATRQLAFSRDLSLCVQIALVADDDDGKVVPVLDPKDLLLEGQDLFEALPRRDGVDQ